MSTLVRSALPILGATLLAGVVAYIITSAQPQVYQASSSVFSSANTNTPLSDTVFTPPPLPRGAIREALTSPAVVKAVMGRIQSSSDLPAAEKTLLVSKLGAEVANGNVRSLQLTVVDESNSGGVYTVNGRANTPVAARVLTDAGVKALVAWDVKRAQLRMERALLSIREQLEALNTETPDNNVNAAAYQDTRNRLLQNLALTSARAASAAGTLDIVSAAITPTGAVAPRPVRSALLSALLTLVTAIALTLLLANLRPAVASQSPPY
ncbi:hypothetical protein [Deinococcus koreensis]|uniref:Lipopolysaccharide biosynthesis protein n=1 Tax=Deinococcus koreensis TaxID=2054903 RepID=A0A2K3UTC8_9DEIO|nr:hypothetical protein [Deinococcus koreensis]PNY79787.1 hypothetical protein CVO96_17735 [Deinococcus koreensis]